jgi:hypothetical protein
MAQQIPKVPKNVSMRSQSTEHWEIVPPTPVPRDFKLPDISSWTPSEDATEPKGFSIRDSIFGDDLALLDSLIQSQEARQELSSLPQPQHHGPSFCEILPFLEAPVFALSKHPVCTPRRYTTSNGQFTWTITATSSAGAATIMDGDLLIFLITTLAAAMKRQKQAGDTTLRTSPHQMLKALGRATGGRQYRLLCQGLERLGGTRITTNMGASGHPLDRVDFTLIESIHPAPDGSLEIRLPPWITAMVSTKRLLNLSPDYFRLTSGYERFLYRTARKHAGGHGAEGWRCTIPVLFAKSGSTGTPARFKYELRKIVACDSLPDFNLKWIEEGRPVPAIHITRRKYNHAGVL